MLSISAVVKDVNAPDMANPSMPVNRERALVIMREHNLDAVVTMTPENMTYLTDFPMLHGCLAETKVYVIFPAASDQQPSIVIPRNSVDMLTSSPSTVEDIWLHGNFFLFESRNGEPVPQEDEGITECAWHPADEALTTISYDNARGVLRRAAEMVQVLSTVNGGEPRTS